MTIREFVSRLQELPQDATIGISELMFTETTGYDEIAITTITPDVGITDLNYYLVGRHRDWEDW